MLYPFPMHKLTEVQLMIAKQHQKLLPFIISLSIVVDMINEVNAQIRQQVKRFLSTSHFPAVEQGFLSPAHLRFAARKHRHNNPVYVIRIQYKFVKKKRAIDSPSAFVFSAEAIDEREYQPVLPI
jgi:hypothetical protein